MKKFVLLVAFFSASAAMANLPELTLPGAKWVASFNGYVCDDTGTAVSQPTEFGDMSVVFHDVKTDSTLDNVLLTASFSEAGNTCRYNAIIFADNSNNTTELVQSLAYNPLGDGAAYRDCVKGKEVLDNALQANSYLYYGDRPHRLAFLVPSDSASSICGQGAERVGVDFVVKGKL